MTTSSSSTLRVLAHFCVASLFLSLVNAFDPLGIVYEVASPRFVRRAGTLGGSPPAVSFSRGLGGCSLEVWTMLTLFKITETGDSERPYAVDGNTFTDYASAAQRSCNLQYNSCQLAANTDSSVTFSLEDCQDQQNDCIADPPAIGDGNTSMSVSSDDSSDSGDPDSIDSDSESDSTDSDGVVSDATESPEATESATAAEAASTASTVSTADTAQSADSASDESSGSTDADTIDSAAADSEADTAEAQSDAAQSDLTDASTTQAEPTLVAQTTISYDAEFDLVCDL
ncbi:hypothetical protein BDV06DRAFT_160982 [Aspergillus oleicola]